LKLHSASTLAPTTTARLAVSMAVMMTGSDSHNPGHCLADHCSFPAQSASRDEVEGPWRREHRSGSE